MANKVKNKKSKQIQEKLKAQNLEEALNKIKEIAIAKKKKIC